MNLHTPPSPGNDAEFARVLVERILRGETAAEDLLMKEYERGASFILRRFGVRIDDREELLQDVKATALPKIRNGEVREPEKLNGFICGIARGLAINYRRKIQRQNTSADTAEIERYASPQDGPDRAAERAQCGQVVRNVLSRMRERDREILEHFFLRGEDRDVVCARLNISRERFHGVLHRAKRRFHRLLSKT